MSLLTELLHGNPRRFGEFVQLYYEGRSYTNFQIHRSMLKTANGLLELGLQPGDTLLLHMANCPEVTIINGACMMAGIILCPTIFLLSAEELSYIAEHSEADYVVTTPDLLPKVKEACPRYFQTGKVIVSGEVEERGLLFLHELVERQPERLGVPEPGDEDTAVLIYTAGTTDKPKGVLLTHRNLACNVISSARFSRITRDEVSLTSLPLSHSYGLTISLVPWYCGLTTILMRWFDPEEVFRLTEKYHIRTLAGVPAMFIQLLNHPHAPRYNVRSWKRPLTGAAPCPEEVLRAFLEKFGVYLYEGYGLTEASPVVTTQAPHLPVKLGSVGPPIEGVEVRVRDEDGRELPPFSPGEITVKGPNVMKGYFKNPEETERALREGWLYTGDIGYMDEDGYLYIVERKKDLIITDGFNLYPSEVERVLASHPAVSEAAVVGEPDPVRGEIVHAFVRLNEGGHAGEKELIDFARSRLVYYKCPRRITFIDEIPRTIIGKPSRRALRDLLRRLD
jgi:long-chain acyl-CoA synthetase